jgi:hypothetical protein
MSEESELHAYVADKITDDLALRNIPDPSLCRALFEYPLFDEIRRRIRPEHVPVIEELCYSEDVSIQQFAIGLLRGIEDDEEVRSLVRSLWSKRRRYPEHVTIKIFGEGLMYDDFVRAHADEVLEYIDEHWPVFQDEIRDWVNGNVVDYARERVTSEKIPDHKKWIYLVAAGASDSERARTFVDDAADELVDSSDIESELVREARSMALERLD